MSLTQILLAIIAVLGGGFLYQKNRANTAEAKTDNLATKEKLNTFDEQIAKNNGTLESEEQKQNELKKELSGDVQEDSMSSLVDFFNQFNKK